MACSRAADPVPLLVLTHPPFPPTSLPYSVSAPTTIPPLTPTPATNILQHAGISGKVLLSLLLDLFIYAIHLKNGVCSILRYLQMLHKNF